MNAVEKLIEGYQDFLSHYLDKQNDSYRKWAANNQQPKVMMISCSDSRVNPNIITHAGLGEIFTVQNVANLVPPYKAGKDTHHSTSSAIEFAVNYLGVEHIIIMGHSKCGGIRALMEGQTKAIDGSYSFISTWMEIVAKARDHVNKIAPEESLDERCHMCEKQAVLTSLDNLRSFPWVKEKINNGNLQIHAWYFNLEDGRLKEYHTDKQEFIPILQR